MENILLEGALLAESIENTTRAIVIDEDITYSLLLEREQEILNRCLTNTKVKLSDEAYNYIYTEIFYLIKALSDGNKTGKAKQKIQAIYVSDKEEPNKLQEFLDKTDDKIEDISEAVEKGKEIYEKSKPIVNVALKVIGVARVFFGK